MNFLPISTVDNRFIIKRRMTTSSHIPRENERKTRKRSYIYTFVYPCGSHHSGIIEDDLDNTARPKFRISLGMRKVIKKYRNF